MKDTTVTRAAKFVALSVEWALETLRNNKNNRKVNWGQVNTLLQSWRGWDIQPDGSKLPSWVDDACSWIIDYTGQLADGQHRLIALVLAYGTREQIEELLRILDASRQSMFDLNDKVKTEGFDRTKSIGYYVPIAGFEIGTGKNIPSLEGRSILVLYGADPRAADKADTDQKKRTGADQIGRHADCANRLALLGISADEIQPVVRAIYLRTMPPTEKAREEGSNYGTLRKGGNIHPDRFPPIFRVLADHIDKAMDALYGDNGWEHQPEDYVEPRDLLQTPFSFLHWLSNFTLAVQGGATVEQLRQVMAWLTIPPNTRPTGLLKVVIDCRKDKTLSHHVLPYIVSRCINLAISGDGLPDIKTLKQLMDWIGSDFEQVAANRLPGWDSTGCEDLISSALKNKQTTAKNAKKHLAKAS